MGRTRGKRKGTNERHICPKCEKHFQSKKLFIRHIDAHDWSTESTARDSALRLRLEAILLGLATSALWDFIKWAFTTLQTEQVIRTLGGLFYLHRPMGVGGRLRVGPIIGDYIARPPLRGEAENSLEEGLYQGLDDRDVLLLSDCLLRWSTPVEPQAQPTLESVFQRAVDAAEIARGVNHETVLTARNNLAGLYFEQKRFDKAYEEYRRVLDIRLKGSPEHPAVIPSMRNIAVVSAARGDIAGALSAYKEAIVLCEQICRTDQSLLNELATEYAFFLRDHGENAEALDIKRRFNLPIYWT